MSSSSLDGTDGHKHVVFTPKEMKRGLRAPAIVVSHAPDSFATFCRQLCTKFVTN